MDLVIFTRGCTLKLPEEILKNTCSWAKLSDKLMAQLWVKCSAWSLVIQEAEGRHQTKSIMKVLECERTF